ncbi:uncharacterized protein An09g01600 [Aspergillus niger]|uniref:Contig An09c0040, genomic contig n=2 Tax=Aspergillus niger TaxID=5061 RepID=A2QTC5_ASPNC|nr:uncharacterized protein An09g01600 [Aspergillus niger]CAK49081.1 unnamed protein product [Aspergillus niger]
MGGRMYQRSVALIMPTAMSLEYSSLYHKASDAPSPDLSLANQHRPTAPYLRPSSPLDLEGPKATETCLGLPILHPLAEEALALRLRLLLTSNTTSHYQLDTFATSAI